MIIPLFNILLYLLDHVFSGNKAMYFQFISITGGRLPCNYARFPLDPVYVRVVLSLLVSKVDITRVALAHILGTFLSLR